MIQTNISRLLSLPYFNYSLETMDQRNVSKVAKYIPQTKMISFQLRNTIPLYHRYVIHKTNFEMINFALGLPNRLLRTYSGSQEEMILKRKFKIHKPRRNYERVYFLINNPNKRNKQINKTINIHLQLHNIDFLEQRVTM